MINPDTEDRARKLAQLIRMRPLDQLVDWLKREEGLSERQALWVAQEVLGEQPKAPARQKVGEVGANWNRTLEAVRGHLLAGKPLSPLAEVGAQLGISAQSVSQALKQLSVEGLCKQQHKPGTPSYVRVWVRTAEAKTIIAGGRA